MKSKTTSIWFALAALLLAFIWFQHKYLQPATPVVTPLIPGLITDEVTGLQISPAGKREISVVRTNGAWLLQKPLVYPAQAAAVESLASALAKLVPARRLSAAEMRGHKNADAEYGFENPQFSLIVEAGGLRQQLIIGSRTAPGDQVFVRVVGTDGAYVTDANWLQLLPRSPEDWRDTSLVAAAGTCNWIVITNGTKSMEFRRDATNQLWRMTRPLQTRADGAKLTAAIQQLRDGRITQFITDDPRTDLSNYGLQPADLDVWLGRGTNFVAAIHEGKNLPTNSAQVYVQREGWNAVLAADKDVFAPWRATVNDFRDPCLLSLTSPVAEIEVRGQEPFTLQQRGSNDWIVAGEKFSADPEIIQSFLKRLTSLRISEFVKDVPTDVSLEGYGLAAPSRQIILRGKAGDTNDVLAQLMFGATETNRVFVKNADEAFVYAVRPEDVARLPEHGWEFRDRHIWNFSETNIVSVTLRQNSKTRLMTRTGTDKWSLDAGQGSINPPAIEETMHRMGELTVTGWVGRNVTAPEKYGLNPDNLSVTVELKSGEKLGLDFGLELPQGHTALAATTLNGERWVFVFPPTLYQFVTTYLIIPPNTP